MDKLLGVQEGIDAGGGREDLAHILSRQQATMSRQEGIDEVSRTGALIASDSEHFTYIAEQGNVQCVEHDSIGQVQNIHSKVMLFKPLMKTSVVETLHRMRFNFAGFILRGFAIFAFFASLNSWLLCAVVLKYSRMYRVSPYAIIVYGRCRSAKLAGLVAVASEERVCANSGKGLGRSSVQKKKAKEEVGVVGKGGRGRSTMLKSAAVLTW